MRKKSHISLAGYLIGELESEQLDRHKKAFYFGSILPDLTPKMFAVPHEFQTSYRELQEKIRGLIAYVQTGEGKERVVWRRLGVVMHYLADYFTFPHNKNFTGNLYEHNKYEKHLKNHLKRYIESGAADRMVILPVNFGSFRELVEYIGNAHERYLLKERNIAEDVQYILRICSQVIHGILQLAAKQFGREDILIPAAC